MFDNKKQYNLEVYKSISVAVYTTDSYLTGGNLIYFIFHNYAKIWQCLIKEDVANKCKLNKKMFGITGYITPSGDPWLKKGSN